jgi:hypothetical protein
VRLLRLDKAIQAGDEWHAVLLTDTDKVMAFFESAQEAARWADENYKCVRHEVIAVMVQP